MLRRSAAALSAVLLLTVSACGSGSEDSSDSSSSGALKSVAVTGDFGKAVKVKWNGKASATSKVATLVKGKGDKLATGDTVSTYIWVGNATSKKEVYSDYANGAAESIPYTEQLTPFLKKLMKGATYGSRVASVAKATDVFGPQGNAQMGVAATDNVVIVADLVKEAPTSPTPTDAKVHDASPSSMPKVVLKGGKPSALDFAGIDKPALTKPVQRVILKKGNGAALKATSTVTVDYLGSTYDAKAPFDESFSKKPITSALSGLVQGWSIGLSGVKVGSRVLLQMPPAFGYGADGSGQTIPGNSTLWFVIDVVSAK